MENIIGFGNTCCRWTVANSGLFLTMMIDGRLSPFRISPLLLFVYVLFLFVPNMCLVSNSALARGRHKTKNKNGKSSH